MIKVAKAVVGDNELKAIADVLQAGWLGMGEYTLRFEEAVQRIVGAKYVVAVNTGTSALHLALSALGIGPGDEVLVPSITYVASFQAISAVGATPVACESDPDTLLMDLDDAEGRMTTHTKAVMPVHYCGQACDMDRLLTWRSRYGVRIVEDAAHAFGSQFRGRPVGSGSDVTCFSFDPIKVITCGDGGAVVTDDERLAAEMRNGRLLGADRESEYRYKGERQWLYDVPHQGYRYHLSNINAAIGLAQLTRFDQFVHRRRAICRTYDAAFEKLEFARHLRVDYTAAVPFMYILRVKPELRIEFMSTLRSAGIETGIHYQPNHWHRFYRDSARDGLPVADILGTEIVTLPLHCALTDADVRFVIESVQSFAPSREVVS